MRTLSWRTISRQGKAWLVGLVLAAALFRFPALFANTFHADEALFASWARLIAVWRDPLLQTQWIDKPPLLFYGQALFYPLFGPVEWAARWPNFIASLLLVPLIAQLVYQLYGDELAALIAAVVVTLSPFTIQFSATAFTDPLLTTLIVASLVAVGKEFASGRVGRWASGGVWFGLAVATKYQAWLFLPLLVGMGLLSGWRWRDGRRWFMGLVVVLLPLFAWELARTGSFTLWSAQLAGYGGLRPVWSWELWPRLTEWGNLWSLVSGSSILGFGLLLATPVFLALIIHDEDRATAVDHLFLIFMGGYFLLHWFLAVPVWDRYLLPLLPIAAVIVGRFISRLYDFTAADLPDFSGLFGPQRQRFLLLLLLVMVQTPTAWQARHGRFPIGGQPAADSGAAQAAGYLSQAPYGTVLYDHWYSWQWRYHLFDKTVYVSWFPHATALIEDLAVFAGDNHARYLALPNSPAALPIQRALTAAGYRLQPVFSSDPVDGRPGLMLYEIISTEKGGATE